MSDDLNKKIKQITDILGQENMPDNIKGLLSILASPGNKENTPPSREQPLPKQEEIPVIKEERQTRSELEENLEMVRKISKVMEKLNTTHDPRVNLLSAIRPFLSNSRQQRLNNCIKLIQMSSLTKFLDENEKGIF